MESERIEFEKPKLFFRDLDKGSIFRVEGDKEVFVKFRNIAVPAANSINLQSGDTKSVDFGCPVEQLRLIAIEVERI